MVVTPDPWTKRLLALVRSLVGDSEGPLGEHGLNEPFGFAVRAAPVGASWGMFDARFGAERSPDLGSVAGSVVSRYSFDFDISFGEPCNGSFNEPDNQRLSHPVGLPRRQHGWCHQHRHEWLPCRRCGCGGLDLDR